MNVSSFNFLSLFLLLLRNDWGWEDIDEPVEQNNSEYNMVFIAIILFFYELCNEANMLSMK